jgi:uncharacterized protein YbbC (DUF1343 family)/CubicO group peptidase (beta-lactamase class C family)
MRQLWIPTLAVLVLAATLHGRAQVADSQAFGGIDRVVTEAIAAQRTPGAVVLVGRGDDILYEKAFGRRSVVPEPEPLTLDTIFDLASLTKVVATTTAVMQQVERGRLRLSDPVSLHVPGFERYGKAGITVRHLLTHVSGLRPDVDLHPWEGYDTAIALAVEEVPTAPPGERFIYSDINFFLLGHIVSRLTGVAFEEYVRREIFEPLRMTDTGFNPPAQKRDRIAPTERCDRAAPYPCNTPDAPHLRGVVHDPTARRMGGVAGHAGLFGTARDLSRFARMLLRGGELDGVRILAPATVARMIAPSTPAGMTAVRGLGWDIETQYSSNRGELFPFGSFGHTGFTGTSMWVDPSSRSYVVFLSSRLHPDGTGDVTPLRARVATIAAAALSAGADQVLLREPFALPAPPPAPAPPDARRPVLPGIDVLARDGFSLLKGKRVGLLTNHTGRSITGASTIDLLHKAPGVTLVSLFSPEHGIRGILDADVPSSRDERTGLPIHSLYGATRRPTAEMLADLDTIVIDLQDIGARFYTYPATVGYILEEAAGRKISVVLLDRPNPVNGWQIEGPPADDAVVGFTAYLAAIPIRHGLTLGELARLFNDERKIGASLTVVPAAHWRRGDWFDETGLVWVNPSPNMRNLNQAVLYPGIGAIEYSNISVGRGTDQPFEQIGAPWIDGRALAATLNGRGIPGIRFYPITFTPTSSKYANQSCEGVFMVITSRVTLPSVRLGLEVAAALWKLHGDRYQMENTDRLFGSRAMLERAKAGEDPQRIAAEWLGAEARWRLLRAKYLLY